MVEILIATIAYVGPLAVKTPLNIKSFTTIATLVSMKHAKYPF